MPDRKYTVRLTVEACIEPEQIRNLITSALANGHAVIEPDLMDKSPFELACMVLNGKTLTVSDPEDGEITSLSLDTWLTAFKAWLAEGNYAVCVRDGRGVLPQAAVNDGTAEQIIRHVLRPDA